MITSSSPDLREVPAVTRWRANFFGGLALLLAASAIFAWILQSYFGYDVAASLSVVGADGWCMPRLSGLGVHCWGDWAAIRFSSLASPPSGSEAVYPMSTRIFRLPFEVAGAAFGDRVALTAFLATSAAAVLTPWVVATRGQAWSARAQAIVIGGVLTLPFILVMDRGNLIAFVVPAMLLWMTGVLEHRMPYVFVGVVWAAAIKPQFALLAVVLLTFREFLWFARSVVAVLAVLLLPFLLLGGDVVASVHRWGSALQKFSESRSMSSDYPGNVSFAHTTWWLSDHVGIGISMNTAIVASFVLCAMLLAVLAWRGMQLPRGVLAIAVLCIVSLVVPISSLYYLVFAIPAAAMAYRRGGLDGTTASTPLDIVFMFAVLLSLAPLLLVIGEIQLAPGSWVAVSATPLLSSASWFTFALLAAVTSVQGRRDA